MDISRALQGRTLVPAAVAAVAIAAVAATLATLSGGGDEAVAARPAPLEVEVVKAPPVQPEPTAVMGGPAAGPQR